jgi:hypothetical protein
MTRIRSVRVVARLDPGVRSRPMRC